MQEENLLENKKKNTNSKTPLTTMEKVVFTPNHFEICKKVSWDDVIHKIDLESLEQQYSIIENSSICFPKPPTIVLCSEYNPDSIQSAFDEVENDCKVQVMHTYVSFCRDVKTYGRHSDGVDVLIVQSIGEVSYHFDDGSSYDLTPGDSIYIPKGTYHHPIVKSPRVTLSFSWE